MRENSERAVEAYGEPQKNVTEFRYLGRVLMAGYDYWLAVVGNLGKARKSLGWLSRILSWERTDPKVSRIFYESVSQAVLLFGAETLVITPWMERALDIFHHRVARRLTGGKPRIKGDGSWAYTPLEESMEKAGIDGIRKSVMRRQNTVAQYIKMQPTLDLCERSTRRPGARVFRWWWEQAGIDLGGGKKRSAKEATDSESESESD